MIWVESGAKHRTWNSRPMQIGNPGDPGLKALLGNKEGGELIVPLFIPRLTEALAGMTPQSNIRSGVGYLLMRMAKFEYRDVNDPDTTIRDAIVKPGDSIDRIARAVGSTPATMKHLNPGAFVLRPGQVLKYRKSSIKRVIAGWSAINSTTIALRYNVGDTAYREKLDYALAAIIQRKDSACE